MKLEDFIERWQGKFLDYDGAWENQCFDLLRQYCYECLNLTDIQLLTAPSCAKELFTKFDSLAGNQYFEKIVNTPDAIPKEGDIIVWGMEPYGHVAIFYEGDVNRFRSFDQNHPLNSPCHIQEHNYNSILGWLRFKIETNTIIDIIFITDG